MSRRASLHAPKSKSITAAPAKPATPTFILSRQTGFHSLTLSFDFNANIVSGAESARFSIQKGGGWGEWTCDYAKTDLGLTFTLLPPPNDFGHETLRYKLKFAYQPIHQSEEQEIWASDEKTFSITIKAARWEAAAAASKETYDPDSLVRYRLELEMAVGTPPRPREFRSATSAEARVLLDRLPKIEFSAASPDVRLFFPDAIKLWTHSEFLSFCSPYMKTLLSSDFAESVSVPAKRPKTQKAVSLEAAVPSTSDAYYDSDEETDEVFFSKNVHALSDEVEHEYKEIKVTKTAFSTYRAVLAYLRTGHIAFAPLTSKCGIEVVDDEEETPSRRAQVELAAGEHPNRPYLVSPKSVYRLAHLLDLQNLQASCITILREGGLTETSAPVELFDETCMLHEPWRNVVVDYIARHWAGVKQTAAWKDVEKKLDADEIPGAMPIMMQLFKAREKFNRTSRYY
ncbi:hypothetical protein JCM10021v2_003933 [Rhodotorula toruloides]